MSQAAFLSQLFMRTKGLSLQRGTCLTKSAYGSHRFSEDLDFNSKN
jgi:predicted nucleotidyltransferase component of viral defense system